MGKLPVKPIRNILVLVLCVCSLVIHFAAENFTIATTPGYFEQSMDGGQSLDSHEHSEDDFVFSKQNAGSHLIFLISTLLAAAVFSLLPTCPPHLPPPKFNPTA
jgi:hypothetical protein